MLEMRCTEERRTKEKKEIKFLQVWGFFFDRQINSLLERVIKFQFNSPCIYIYKYILYIKEEKVWFLG